MLQRELGVVGGKGMDFRTRLPQRCGIHDVVEVLVGEYQMSRSQSLLCQPFRHTFRGVDQDSTGLRWQKVSIGFGNAAGVGEKG